MRKTGSITQSLVTFESRLGNVKSLISRHRCKQSRYIVNGLSKSPDPAEYRRLRSSSDQTRLVVSRSFKCAGDMSFTIAAARLWNDLPVSLRESQSLPMLKRKLKLYL